MVESVGSNKQRLGRMLELVGAAFGPFVENALEKNYGTNWRLHAAFPDSAVRGGKLDLQAYLRLFQNEWREVFSQHLGHTARDAVVAVNAARNAWAHVPAGGDVPNDVTLRGLTGGAELMEAIKSPKAKDARAIADGMISHLARKAAPPPVQTRVEAPSPGAPAEPLRQILTLRPETPPAPRPVQLDLLMEPGGKVGSLEPWRFVAPPREDITSGRLTLDHFAANLAVVDRGEADDAYGDPQEFFRSTYITGGLKLVLESGASRLATGIGPSVIGLQTNFGGGKTHTMLALLHLVRASDPASLAGIKDILGDRAGGLKGAKAVAFSGTDKGPDVPLAVAGGRPVRTIWGYLAWRLAGERGLDLVAGAEAAGTNPGGEALEQVLRAVGGPSLILLDEIVAYVKQLRDERYEAALAFFQSLTEAATRVPQALIVGSLPQSEDEAGGDRGRETLERLERLFGRVQSSWQAAQGAETYAIVRRRLFQDLDAKGEKARDATVEAFRKLYRENKKDFPSGVDAAAYGELMREAYPVHPILFDQLAQDWGGLERFQRTRGVLKFVAESARRIWLTRSMEPLIQPASIPLRDPAVRGAVIEPLEGSAWTAIVDGEVDSDRSLPELIDGEKQRFGEKSATTRAARAVFLGTAPRAEAGGMTAAAVRLSAATPGDNLSIFADALAELQARAGHLYSNGAGGSSLAYWFGPQPTLRKMAEARAHDLAASNGPADDAIILQLKAEERSRGRFARMSVCPDNPEDVEEGTSTALVILHPRYDLDPRAEGSPAMAAAEDAVKRRGGGRLRQARNTLVFVAADKAALAEARKAARLLIAWRSIRDDKALDLKESQRDDAKTQTDLAAAALETLVRRAWSQILCPAPRRAQDGEPFDLDRTALRNPGSKSVGQAVWERVSADGAVLEKLGRVSLADRLSANWPAGADHLALTTVRDWFAQFVQFERLRDETVLADAIGELIADPFMGYAYAQSVGEDGRYRGLVMPGHGVAASFDGASLLVLKEAAERQAPRMEPSPGDDRPPGGSLGPSGPGAGSPAGGPGDPAPDRVLRRFYGSVDLDAVRPIPALQKIVDEVVGELLRTSGAEVSLRLEIEATAPEGFAPEDAAVVRDNARSLRFRAEGTGFEEE